MRRRLFGPLVVLACTMGVLGGAATAGAAPVLVLLRGGHVVVRQTPFVPAAAPIPAPVRVAGPRALSPARMLADAHRARRAQVTIGSTLARLHRGGEIDAAEYAGDRTALAAAIATAARLRGTRAVELYSVLTNMHRMALAGELTPSRLPVLFLTLENNRRWWSTGPLLTYGQQVQFPGSRLVWEYYQGQGIELQVLGSFGEADGYFTAGRSDYPKLRQVLSELIPLAAHRAGGLVWEYYFAFDGGRPPWASAMAQGTAIEALTRAYVAFQDPAYLALAARALPLFSALPPAGVRIPTARGARYLQYSFAPGLSIINAFLQSLIGLYDYAHASGNREARQLFDAGNAEARAEVPRFNTGAWSLYQPGLEDALSYHQLVTGFLHELCARTAASVYCATARDFERDLKTPPVLTVTTHRAQVGALTYVHFWLSKESRVGIVEVVNGATIFATSAELGYGSNSFGIPTPRLPGTYTVRLSATDLAGNFSRVAGTLVVAPAAKGRSRG